MTKFVRTETGSLYEIDFTNKRWTRLEAPKTVGANPLRTLWGNFWECTEPVVGKSMQITAEPIDPTMGFRSIITSHVVEIRDTL